MAPTGIGSYVGRMWTCRYFWLSLVERDLRVRYRRSALGMCWSLLNPLLMTALIATVFHQLFHHDLREFIPYLLSGLACWAMFSQTVLQGCEGFIGATAYIRLFPAPLAIYPLRVVLGAAFHFCILLGILLLYTSLFRTISWQVIPSLAVAMVILLAAGWAVAALCALAHTWSRDTQPLLTIVMQMLFFATPVIYPRTALGNQQWSWLLENNPLLPFLDLVRAPAVFGVAASGHTFLAATGWTLLLMGVAIIALQRNSRGLVYWL